MIAAPVAFARRLERTVKVVVLTTSYPRDADDVAGTFVRDGVEALRARGHRRARRLACGVPPLRDRLRRRDRQQPRAAPWKAARAAALPARRSRARRVGRRAKPTSSTRTGCRARCPHWRPGSRSCSSSGARMLRSRERMRPLARWLVRRARGRRVRLDRARRRRSRARRAGCSRDPERRRDPRHRSASRTSRRTSCTWVASRRRRAFASSPKPRAACRSSSSATARFARCSPTRVGFVPPRELGAVLRARSDRRRSVPP